MSKFGKPSYLYLSCKMAFKTFYIISTDMTIYDELPASGFNIDTKRKLNSIRKNLPKDDNWNETIIKQSAVNHTVR